MTSIVVVTISNGSEYNEVLNFPCIQIDQEGCVFVVPIDFLEDIQTCNLKYKVVEV